MRTQLPPTMSRVCRGMSSSHEGSAPAGHLNHDPVRELSLARKAPVHLFFTSYIIFAITGAKTSDTTAISLINMFIEGPDVSLNGSPTVSPTTAALWASEPLPP